MQNTPKGMRLHIGIFGKRNAGKSSILNALVKQTISIVSDTAGTTTDPVEKSMELLPVGPVLFVDTAGVDDTGALGFKRVEQTRKIMDRVDLAIIVCDFNGFDQFENMLIKEFQSRKIPVIVAVNKIDEQEISAEDLDEINDFGAHVVFTSTVTREGIDELKQAIVGNAPEDFLADPSIAADLIPAGEVAVLVIPVDTEAPKGRLILPQVQTIRDLLDNDSIVMVTKERELKKTMDSLKNSPALVITDSQAFLKVAADVPRNVKLTSFSILFARFKGELNEFVKGTLAIDDLKSGDKVLICESCTHHAIGDDIGRVKIPRWLTQYTGAKLQFEHFSGHEFPPNIDDYALIIHCGACMTNRREILTRIFKAKNANVPITNYGLTIAFSLGIFERALEPFPAAQLIYEEHQVNKNQKK